MNDKCKYCDYVSKCSRICEYDSYLCKVHRSFPKVVDKSYEQLQQENKHLDEVNCKLRKTNEHLRTQIRVRESVCDRLAGNWNLLKRYCYKIENDENTKLNGLYVLNKMQELEKGSYINE